jgi:hypothetical protein
MIIGMLRLPGVWTEHAAGLMAVPAPASLPPLDALATYVGALEYQLARVRMDPTAWPSSNVRRTIGSVSV